MSGKPRNRVGERYGKLTVIEMLPATQGHERRMKCRCDCGNIVEYNLGYLTTRARDCGCGKADKNNYRSQRRKIAAETREANKRVVEQHGGIEGCKFTRLTVLHADVSAKSHYVCRCDCGNTITVQKYKLMSGEVKSCGCLSAAKAKERLTVHGDSETRLYQIYKRMSYRCYDPNYYSYPSYGGRGITVCDSWKNDWLAFKQWALSNGYDDEKTLERIDSTKGYSPDNCRIAERIIPTHSQARGGLYVAYQNRMMILSDFCDLIGISYKSSIFAYQKGKTGAQELIDNAIEKGTFDPDSAYLKEHSETIDVRKATRMFGNKRRSGTTISLVNDYYTMAQFARITGIPYKDVLQAKDELESDSGEQIIFDVFQGTSIPDELMIAMNADFNSHPIEENGRKMTPAEFAKEHTIPVTLAAIQSARGMTGPEILDYAHHEGFGRKNYGTSRLLKQDEERN